MPANVNFLKKLVRRLKEIGLDRLEAKALFEKMGHRNRTLETTAEASSTCLREFYEYLSTYKISAGKIDEFPLKKLDTKVFEETRGEAFREVENAQAKTHQLMIHEARKHHRALVRAQDFTQYNQVASTIRSYPKKPKGSFPIEVRYDYNKASDLGETSAGSPPFETFYLSKGAFLIRTYLNSYQTSYFKSESSFRTKEVVRFEETGSNRTHYWGYRYYQNTGSEGDLKHIVRFTLTNKTSSSKTVTLKMKISTNSNSNRVYLSQGSSTYNLVLYKLNYESSEYVYVRE